MRSLRHVVAIVGVAGLLAACTTTTAVSPAASSDDRPPSTTASSVPSVSVSLSLPSGGTSTTAAASAPTAAVTDVRKVSDAAGFATPSGRIVCIMADNSVRCDFIASDKAWTTPQPKDCQLDWGDSLQLTQTSGSTCHGDTLADTPALDSGFVGWHRSSDPTVSVNDLTLAALPYGSALLLGTLQCESASTGVTCRNTSTGHGFTMSREAYSVF